MRALPALLLIAAATAAAQAPVAPRRSAFDALNAGRYLEAVDGFAALALDGRGEPRDQAAYQTWMQVAPFVADELDPAAFDRLGGPPPDPALASRVAAAAPRDALREIVRRARLTSVVVLNEDHASPRDRAFASEVARALRPLGYSVLAAEAISNDGRAAPALARDGFARLSTGHYVKDPVFADHLRRALALGYRPVAYEQTEAQRPPGSGVDERERAQAENLMAAVFRADPKAKVLIHVGHSHVAEAPIARGDGRPTEWMAARLKRLTGVDPLTIDQTGLTDLARATRAAHAAARVGARPAVLFENGGPLVVGRFAGAVDLQVVHPRRAYRHGRPTWLARAGRRPLAIPRALLPTTGRRLVQAFAAGAPADAVPLDQVVVEAGRPAPSLMVPPVPLRLAVQP